MVRVVAAFAADKRYSDMLRITIQPLVAMLGSGEATVVTHAARAITSLSHSEPNRDALRDAGALPRMAGLLLHDDEAVQQCHPNPNSTPTPNPHPNPNPNPHPDPTPDPNPNPTPNPNP